MYVTRATDGIAATYPTQSPGDAGAEPSCASGFPRRWSIWLIFKVYDGGGDAAFQGQVEIQVEIAGAQRQHPTVGDQRNGEQTDRCRLDDLSSICWVWVIDAP
jgi:hypothetical protein